MEIADWDNLQRDIELFATAVWRLANSPVVPFDYRLTLALFRETLDGYQAKAGERFDFSPVDEDLSALSEALDDFYARVDRLNDGDAERDEARPASHVQ